MSNSMSEEQWKPLAKELREKGLYGMGVEIWSRAGFRCEYCASELLLTPQTFQAATSDHILPVSKYPHLAKDFNNYAHTCGLCNKVKRNWDPADNDKEFNLLPSLTDDQRQELIERTRAHLMPILDKLRRNIEEIKLVLESHSVNADLNCIVTQLNPNTDDSKTDEYESTFDEPGSETHEATELDQGESRHAAIKYLAIARQVRGAGGRESDLKKYGIKRGNAQKLWAFSGLDQRYPQLSLCERASTAVPFLRGKKLRYSKGGPIDLARLGKEELRKLANNDEATIEEIEDYLREAMRQ